LTNLRRINGVLLRALLMFFAFSSLDL